MHQPGLRGALPERLAEYGRATGVDLGEGDGAAGHGPGEVDHHVDRELPEPVGEGAGCGRGEVDGEVVRGSAAAGEHGGSRQVPQGGGGVAAEEAVRAEQQDSHAARPSAPAGSAGSMAVSGVVRAAGTGRTAGSLRTAGTACRPSGASSRSSSPRLAAKSALARS